ncbi:MAG: hypothetical protein U0984_05835 [Prosthecobacter sp.]|nr:hypothetical protein [Prosthecobacter sp.]
MNATPLIASVLAAMRVHRLEAVMIGNAAAAIHGAPVTTLDVDFMFRDTALNLKRLKAVSRDLKAVIMRPYYPVSKLYRLVNDECGLQADFMPVIHGVRSFPSLKSRAVKRIVGGEETWLASLEDIIKSKRSACRLRDQAVIPILEQTLHALQKNKDR